MTTQIGYYDDDIRANIQALLSTSKVEVLMADGRRAIAQHSGKWDSFWVRFSCDLGNGMEILWSQADDAVLEITGLICDKCKGTVVAQVLRTWCDPCRFKSDQRNAVRTFDSNRRHALINAKLSRGESIEGI